MNNAYRDGCVHVCARLCDTCIFRKEGAIDLAEGRVEEMVAQACRSESAIICHATLSGAEQAVCRGFFEQHKTAPLQIAERLDLITFQEPPPCFAPRKT